MKTVGQPFEVALRLRFDQAEPVADDAFEPQLAGLGLADQQPGDLIRHIEQPLRHADIDHQHARHQLRLRAQRRQQGAVAGRRPRALLEVEIGQRFRRHQHLARRRDEGLQPGAADRRCVADLGGDGDGLDPQQPQ